MRRDRLILSVWGTVVLAACSSDAGIVSDGGRNDVSIDGGGTDASDVGETDAPADDGGTDAALGNLAVVSVTPTARAVSARAAGGILVHFDRPLLRSSVTSRSFWAFGRWSGPVRNGAYTFSDGDTTVTLLPARALTAGDRVTVVLSHDLTGADGTKLRAAGYSFQFWTATSPAAFTFTEIGRLTTRTDATAQALVYGASVTDLNGDGYLDLLTVNEITADLRIFLNKGDGSGQYLPFVQPTTPLGLGASPSEVTDFNGDGVADLVVSNGRAHDITILIGNGDGTFRTSQRIAVGLAPRGVAVLDVDGDGDIDIVNSNADSDNLTLLRNNGAGLFPDASPGIVSFDAGHGQATVSQEYGLSVGDMDEDAVLDLVIGARGLANANVGLAIDRGNGDGTFSFASFQGPQAMPWQLAVGDLDGDGHEDVATADAVPYHTLTVFRGSGTGTMQVVRAYSAEQDAIPLMFPLAVDLGDLDGDGDLDVVVSNFQGVWNLLRNDGAGGLTQATFVRPTSGATCAVLLDVDNDRDLDLALLDETADELIIMRQN
jgi:hypothetical protein